MDLARWTVRISPVEGGEPIINREFTLLEYGGFIIRDLETEKKVNPALSGDREREMWNIKYLFERLQTEFPLLEEMIQDDAKVVIERTELVS